MIAEITALVGILSTLSALWISVSDHRQRATEAREAARERERAENERRIAERDAERLRLEEAAKQAEEKRLQAETEAELERKQAEKDRMWQLNQLVIRLRPDAAPGPGGWSLSVRNPSELPVLEVQGFWRGSPLAAPVDVQGSAQIEIPGPRTAEQPRLADLSVHLTDARQHRWRWDLDGRPWSGTPAVDGTGYAWELAEMRWGPSWGAPPAPVPVGPPPTTAHPLPGPQPQQPLLPGQPPERPDVPTPWPAPVPAAVPASAPSAAERPAQSRPDRPDRPDCPICGTPATDGSDRYCDECGYDRQLAPTPQAPVPPETVPVGSPAWVLDLSAERSKRAGPSQQAGVPAPPPVAVPAPSPAVPFSAPPYGSPAYTAPAYGGPAPDGPPPVPVAMGVGASAGRRAPLRPALLALSLLSVACYVVLFVVK